MLSCVQDWDKPENIPDPDAKKPDDWDDEMDGEWEPPMVTNPDYKVNTLSLKAAHLLCLNAHALPSVLWWSFHMSAPTCG